MTERFSLFWQDTVSLVKTGLRSSVARNAASLYLIQFANYILPLITIPYLVRVLGPAGFGVVAFGQSLISYFAIFVDYGFNFSATRKISVERNDPRAVSQTVSNVWAAKLLLCITGFIFLVFLVLVVQDLREIGALIFILYGYVVGNVLSPFWLYQGMEKMVSISIINLASRILVVIGIFSLVRRPDDVLIYAGLINFGIVASGCIAALVSFFKFNLHLSLPSLKGVRDALIEGWFLFLSTASVSIFTAGNAFILGILANHTIVGYYSATERIVRVFPWLLLMPLAYATYPKFSKMAAGSEKHLLVWARQILLTISGIGFLLMIGVILTAPIISSLLFGREFTPTIYLLRILASIIPLVAISNVLSFYIMLPLRKDKPFLFLVLTGGCIKIVLGVIMAAVWQAIGMAIAVLLSEIFVTASMLIYLQINGIPLVPITWRKACNK